MKQRTFSDETRLPADSQGSPRRLLRVAPTLGPCLPRPMTALRVAARPRLRALARPRPEVAVLLALAGALKSVGAGAQRGGERVLRRRGALDGRVLARVPVRVA